MKLAELSTVARQAAARRDWRAVKAYAEQILKLESIDPEGLFLMGLAQKNTGQLAEAKSSFLKSKKADKSRYDVAIEAAEITQRFGDHGAAVALLKNIEALAGKSPLYLFNAAEIYTRAGLHVKAWPLLQKAADLQPGAVPIQVSKALCASKVGELKLSEKLLTEILVKIPEHQRLHYELSKLRKAKNTTHIAAMKALIGAGTENDEKNIFALFAIGKELEDLENWPEAFEFYARGNQAAWEVGQRQGYVAQDEIDAINAITREFTADACAPANPVNTVGTTPVFIVGLPRSGTTLLEKIVTGHKDVESVDESYFLENAAKQFCKMNIRDSFKADHFEHMAKAPGTSEILTQYLRTVDYRRTGAAFFIEKYPMNFQFLGLIARHLPSAKILYMRRSPIDICLALFKQPYFRFSFDLHHLADYYHAYQKLEAHWESVLGDRVHFVDYEQLVQDPAPIVKGVMRYLDLGYSDDLLEFHKRKDASASASSAQIREKLYTRSIGKWKNWTQELAPLTDRLAELGIKTD